MNKMNMELYLGARAIRTIEKNLDRKIISIVKDLDSMTVINQFVMCGSAKGTTPEQADDMIDAYFKEEGHSLQTLIAEIMSGIKKGGMFNGMGVDLDILKGKTDKELSQVLQTLQEQEPK
jgi:hypothetical protein